jgi:hypothetical protein
MKMNQWTGTDQLVRLQERYARRNREGRRRMLDEVCEQYGYHRKYAIRLLGGTVTQRPPGCRRGPAPKYEPIRDVVARIWQAAEQICGKRLAAALPLWRPYYARHFGRLLPTQGRLLDSVSAATLDRLLQELRAERQHGRSGTRPGSLLRQHVPIQGEVWDESRPGFLEADSVAHCGSSLRGDFVWSLVYTDLASGWTAGRAVWNKGAHGVLMQTQDVEQRLPFELLGFDFDNGNEWLNWTLIRHLQERDRPIQVTRSRPYHKNDNAHVEQKNWMWPRQLLGYGRLGDPGVVGPINALYRESWEPLQNFFLPSMKLKSKHREGSRWVRHHDTPQTACDRLLNHDSLSAKQKRHLRDRRADLDPFTLAAVLERQLQPILRQATKERLALVS